ncbi:MAG TPA: AAA family ATPase [Actinomycetota bacterium]|nr:AAA family ATPase [Actinomycetota bacterium]
MPVACPSCGAENPDAAKFCAECGSALTGSPSLGRKERKYATALFADLVGSTSLAEQQDPEIVQSVVSRTFDRLSQEIERYGGVLEKFMGDAVLALFGVPTSHDDDPERAVRAALEMLAVLSELNHGFAAEGKPVLAMRVGIEAGEALVDLERVAGARDRMITGDSVNVAARLQSAADPGTIVVGPNAYAATKETLEYRPLEPLTLKGKAEPVPAFEAIRLKARARGERPPLGLESRLIGRDEEFSLLSSTFHRAQSEGRPALVTVLGPAGVGKSRLALEFHRHLDRSPERVYWRRGRCLAYGNLSYSALAEAVKAQCDILEDDPPPVVDEKAAQAVEMLFGDRALSPHIQALVGGASGKELGREELFEAWRRFLERMAARYPLALVLEDIHWADEGLLDFVDHLTDWAQGPILILTMARPDLLERRPSWGGGKRNYAAIYLDPLTPDETGAMLDDLLETALPDELKSVVVERSEGNPLFSEEIVRMFIDRGVLRRDKGGWEVAAPIVAVDVPRSIHALIATRLDSLPADEKVTVQDASVAGRVFWLGSVANLSGRSRDDARTVLGRLRIKEIVITRDPPVFSNESEFAFRHALIRDVAYDSLPKALRADKHVMVAEWAEQQAGERREEIAELLATHYTEALRYLDELGETNGRRSGVVTGAFRWARAAGDRAHRLGQSKEATRWFRTAMELAEAAEASRAELASLHESMAEAQWGIESYEGLVGDLQSALDLYCDLGMERDAGRVESRIGLLAFYAGRDEDVLPMMRTALSRLEPLGDTAELARALDQIGTYWWRRGNLEEAEKVLRRSLEISARVGDRVTQGHSLQSLGIVENNKGNVAEGLRLVEEAYELAEDVGDVALRLRVANNLPALLADQEHGVERAIPILREGLELARRTNHTAEIGWLIGTLGDFMWQVGNIAESISLLEESVPYARAVGEAALVGHRLQGAALSHITAGNVEEAERAWEEAEPVMLQNPEPQALRWVPILRAWIRLARGEREGAATELAGAVEEYLAPGKAFDEMPSGAVTLLELVRTLVHLGRTTEAVRYVELFGSTSLNKDRYRLMADWGRALVKSDPSEAKQELESVIERLRKHERRVDIARCMIDVARVQRRFGEDPGHTLARARQILEECGAKLFFVELEAIGRRAAEN